MFDAQAIFWFAAGAQDSLVCPENFYPFGWRLEIGMTKQI